MKYEPIRQSFLYPDITADHYTFGSGQVMGTVLRPDGNWKDFLPSEEYQNINNVESASCFIEAQQHSIATILEEQYGINDSNFSARFNALLSNGTEQGGDPLKGADSIRNDGLIVQSMMDFDDTIQSWSDFHSWKGVNERLCRAGGKNFVSKWDLKYDIVIKKEYGVETKYQLLKEALKYSPIAVSVYAWLEQNGEYIKPQGANDNHLVELVYIDENNCPYIRDTYSPFTKKLQANFNFDFGLRFSISKKVPRVSLGQKICSFIYSLTHKNV